MFLQPQHIQTCNRTAVHHLASAQDALKRIAGTAYSSARNTLWGPAQVFPSPAHGIPVAVFLRTLGWPEN